MEFKKKLGLKKKNMQIVNWKNLNSASQGFKKQSSKFKINSLNEANNDIITGTVSIQIKWLSFIQQLKFK